MEDDDVDDDGDNGDFQFYRKFVDISNNLQLKGQGGRHHSSLSLCLLLHPSSLPMEMTLSADSKNLFPGSIGVVFFLHWHKKGMQSKAEKMIEKRKGREKAKTVINPQKRKAPRSSTRRHLR